MIHEQIDCRCDLGARPPRSRRRQDARLLWPRLRSDPAHSNEATRFAEICAALGGTAVLADLTPNLVTVSFGERTDAIARELRKLGWTDLGTSEWRGERVLGIFFGESGTAGCKMHQLADDLVTVVADMDVKATRVW